MAGSGCRLASEHVVIAERGQVLGRAVLVDAVEVVGPEVGKVDATLEYVEGGNQDGGG